MEYTVDAPVTANSTNYIRGIYIDLPIDPSFVWSPPPIDTNISVTGLVAGSNVAVLDQNDNLFENNTVAGTSTTININQYLYNPADGYRIRIRKP